MIFALVQNISLLISIAVVYHFVARKMPSKPLTADMLKGILFGASAVFAMSTPFTFAAGIIYDGRTIIIGVAGLFGGPLAAGIAASIASAYRVLVVGGTGYFTGVVTIFAAAIVGIIFHVAWKRNRITLNVPTLLAIGAVIHVSMLASQLLLPDRRWMEVLPVITIPVLVFYPLGFTLISALLIDNEERQANQKRLEESEARYKLLFQNNHTVMLLVDTADGSIVDANPAAEIFYGWPRAKLLTMNGSDLNTIPPEEHKREIAKAFAKKSSMSNFRHRLASGEIRDVEVFTGPIEYFGKKVLFSIIHDASARKQAEREVIELNQTLEQRVTQRTRELEETNRELESFAYSVSHDLRAPLRSIEGFSSLLDDESRQFLPEDSRHYLDRIRYNAKKMNTLIDDLLRLSRVSRQSIRLTRIDLGTLAGEIMEELKAQSPDRNVRVEIEAHMVTSGDHALVDVLVRNLLSNAWKFTATQDIAIIRMYSLRIEGVQTFCVEDNGIGFDMHYSDKLFSPFQRLHGDKEYGGSGIGLSIVRRIAARHGGRTWAQSEPGNGAKFYFTLGGVL